jgi:hypothetical protein|tara:strand:+ start:44 stop:736 length:693 start_codon:yes stop_codon:yes gene_type:complete
MNKKCLECNKEFISSHFNNTYCSKKCISNGFNNKRRLKSKSSLMNKFDLNETKNCIWCKKTFTFSDELEKVKKEEDKEKRYFQDLEDKTPLHYKRANNSWKAKTYCTKECNTKHRRYRDNEHYKTPEGIKKKEAEKLKVILRKYGMTSDVFYEMVKSQNGVCVICKDPMCNTKSVIGKTRTLSVDHDHTTGKYRELLGSKCNTVLGLVKDNITTLENMIIYLRKHKSLDK